MPRRPHALTARRRRPLLCLPALLALATPAARAAAGDPDAAFNQNVGSALNNFGYSVAAQADRKLVVGGGFTSPSNYLARFLGGATVPPGGPAWQHDSRLLTQP